MIAGVSQTHSFVAINPKLDQPAITVEIFINISKIFQTSILFMQITLCLSKLHFNETICFFKSSVFLQVTITQITVFLAMAVFLATCYKHQAMKFQWFHSPRPFGACREFQSSELLTPLRRSLGVTLCLHPACHWID